MNAGRSFPEYSISGAPRLACAQKEGTGPFRNAFSLSFSDSHLCLQMAQSHSVQACVCPLSKPLWEPTLILSASVQREAFEPALNRCFPCRTGWQLQDVNPSKMPH